MTTRFSFSRVFLNPSWHKVLYKVVENPMVVPWSQWLSSVIIADCTLISVMCEP